MEQSGKTELMTIVATRREGTGKGYARKLRQADKLPAVVLERGESTAIELDPKLLAKVWQSGRRFILQLDGATHNALLHEVQIDAVKRTPLHADIMYEQ